MALRCLTALKNSESRSGAMKLPPTADRSLRSLTKFVINDLRRAGSTPVLVWYSFRMFAWRSSSLSTSLRIAARGDGEDLEQAGDGGARTPGTVRLAVKRGLGVEKFDAQEGAHALVERLLVNDGRRLGFCLGGHVRVGVHSPIVSQPTLAGKPWI